MKKVDRCRCGKPLPSVCPNETPPEFCSAECKVASTIRYEWRWLGRVEKDGIIRMLEQSLAISRADRDSSLRIVEDKKRSLKKATNHPSRRLFTDAIRSYKGRAERNDIMVMRWEVLLDLVNRAEKEL